MVRRIRREWDKGCAFPSCDRDPRFTRPHHIPGSGDGQDEPDSLIRLCGYHHQRLHHSSEWGCFFDGDLPAFIPPAWLDPRRKPKTHSRYALRELEPILRRALQRKSRGPD